MKSINYMYKINAWKLKIAFTIIISFLFIFCAAQTPNKFLIGKWKGKRFDMIIYYRFINDSTYNFWIDASSDPAPKEAPPGCYICGPDYIKDMKARRDSSIIYHYDNLDSIYIQIVDQNHFYVLATFYASEKIIFHRVKN